VSLSIVRKRACKEQVKNKRCALRPVAPVSFGRAKAIFQAALVHHEASCFCMGYQRRKGAVLMVSPITAFAKIHVR
jgi:hypothetical protein